MHVNLLKLLFESDEEIFPIKKSFFIDVPEEVKELSNLFIVNGQKLFLVGGAVRDALLGAQPKDYDLVTGATPVEIEKLIPDNWKRLPIGLEHGITTVISPSGEQFEIATFRIDLSGGRRPDGVKFTDMATDSGRRDLSNSALYYDIANKEIIDYVGGIKDIENNVVKAVGDANERFAEDRLRKLRVIRFAGKLGSQIDPDTAQALLDDNSLYGVSPERIRDEFLKGVKSSKSVQYFLDLITKFGLWIEIFPGLTICRTDLTSKSHIVLLASMFIGCNTVEELQLNLNKLSYTVGEVSKIIFLVQFKELSSKTAAKLKKQFLVLRKTKEGGISEEELEEFAGINGVDSSLVDAFKMFESKANPKDLMAKGIKNQELGIELARLDREEFERLLSI